MCNVVKQTRISTTWGKSDFHKSAYSFERNATPALISVCPKFACVFPQITTSPVKLIATAVSEVSFSLQKIKKVDLLN